MNIQACIVIPAYNSENYLRETLDSALSQVDVSFEVIVVDDCSTDSTCKILDEYEGRIKAYKRAVNMGISSNVNYAISKTNAEFILLLGHDDVLEENHLSLMIQSFDAQTGFVFCNANKIDSKGQFIALARDDREQQKKLENIQLELAVDNFISSCGAVFRKSLFEKVGGWDERFKFYGEWLSYIKYASLMKVKYQSKVRPSYRVHQNNITKKISKLNSLEVYKDTCRNLAVATFDFSLYQIFLLRVKIYLIKSKRLLKKIFYKG